MSNVREKPFGVKLIAGFFLLKTAAIAGALVLAHLNQEYRPAALDFVKQLAPPLRLMHLEMALSIAPLFVILGLVLVLGVWFLQGWAWALLLVGCGIPLVRLGQFLIIALAVNRQWLTFLPSSPYFAIDVLSSMFIVEYLVRPEVRRAFGETT